MRFWPSLAAGLAALVLGPAAALPLGPEPVPPPWKAPARSTVPAPRPAPPPPPLLPAGRIVAFYGNPLSPAMGVLGQGSPAGMLAALKTQEQAYQALDPSRPVVGALELVAVVAQADPGPDGSYAARMPYPLIAGELQLARSAHDLLILDVQPGRSPVAAEVQYLKPFLAQPDVELALDPEFDLNRIPGGVPGQEFGTMSAASINGAMAVLSRLVARDHLPPKVLIVHQFLHRMVPDWQAIRPLPGVSFVMDTDGFGDPALKIANYRRFITDQPIGYGGIKLFYTRDTPLLSPAEVLALTPPPAVVIYQ